MFVIVKRFRKSNAKNRKIYFYCFFDFHELKFIYVKDITIISTRNIQNEFAHLNYYRDITIDFNIINLWRDTCSRSKFSHHVKKIIRFFIHFRALIKEDFYEFVIQLSRNLNFEVIYVIMNRSTKILHEIFWFNNEYQKICWILFAEQTKITQIIIKSDIVALRSKRNKSKINLLTKQSNID